MAIETRTETVVDLARVVDADDDLREDGSVTGAALRIQHLTRADGRRVVGAELSERITRRRASGKVYSYWKVTEKNSWSVTKAGLIAHRSIHSRRYHTRHCFDAESITRPLGHMVRNYRHRLAGLVEGADRLVRDEAGLLHADVMVAERSVTALVEQVQRDALEHLGPIPSYQERYPLLGADRRGQMIAQQYDAWLDAENWGQVAKNMFGARNYRRPLAGLVEQVGTGNTALWLSLFRGLVPIDWIIEALRKEAADKPRAGDSLSRWDMYSAMTAEEARWIRTVLRGLPQPMLRRLLVEERTAVVRPLRDAMGTIKLRASRLPTADEIAEAVQRRGHARIRNARELETLLVATAPERKTTTSTVDVLARERQMLHELEDYRAAVEVLDAEEAAQYPMADWEQWKDDEFRQQVGLPLIEATRLARMDREERKREERMRQRREQERREHAEEVAWADGLRQRLSGQEVEGLVVQVATEPETLRRWGDEMSNCIGGYGHALDRRVLGALVADDGSLVANFEANRHRATQLLGRFNADLAKSVEPGRAQRIVDRLVELGLELDRSTLGLRGLKVPQPA